MVINAPRTEGARQFAGQLTQLAGPMRQAGYQGRINAARTMRAKRDQILQQLARLRQERAAKKAADEAESDKRTSAYIGLGATVLGAGIGGVAAGGLGILSAGGLTGLGGAALGAGVGAGVGTGIGRLAVGDPAGGTQIGTSIAGGYDSYYQMQNQDLLYELRSEFNSPLSRGSPGEIEFGGY